ncbi:MAG: cupin domain-containing protein [Eubacteriales bacterium]|nr:cupin domain-containing protein [Eubacteriales bacterium]
MGEKKTEQAFHMDQMEWLKIHDEITNKDFFDKRMISADDEGVMINFSKYPAGYYKPKHTHHCSHGIYVISGKLRTDQGIYGPGSFVWHPEGYAASHGATDEEDCVFLFVSNKPFDITFVDEEE